MRQPMSHAALAAGRSLYQLAVAARTVVRTIAASLHAQNQTTRHPSKQAAPNYSLMHVFN
jgi:hypothetical protein